MLRDPTELYSEDEPGQVEEFVPKVHTKVLPRRPTRAEALEHEITHLPFRDWCDVCVSGRGLMDPHRRRDPDAVAAETRVGKVSFDWARGLRTETRRLEQTCW